MPPSGDDVPAEAAPTGGFVDPFAPAPEDAERRSVATQPQPQPRERGRGDDTAPAVIVRDSLGQAVVSGESPAAASADSSVVPPKDPARDMGQASEEAASESATTESEGRRGAPASPAREGAVPPTPLP